MVAAFLVAGDGLTEGILIYGLAIRNFSDALTQTSFTDAAGDGVQAVVLGLCAIVGVIPAGIGYVLEMLFREAAIYVLVCTVPLVAAGLLANVTAVWFWRTVRWLMAAIAMKPALALALVLGVAIVGGAQGVAGILAGVGVLVISLLAPFVLFRLFAFVDPHSDAGGAFREFLAGRGVDSYGPNNPALALAGAGGGSAAIEDANTGRFDDSIEEAMDRCGVSESCAPGHNDQDNRQDPGAAQGRGGLPPANAGQVVASHRWNDPGDPPAPEPPDGDGGGGPRGGGGAGAAEDAAVII
jgi:hypothetical protein